MPTKPKSETYLTLALLSVRSKKGEVWNEEEGEGELVEDIEEPAYDFGEADEDEEKEGPHVYSRTELNQIEVAKEEKAKRLRPGSSLAAWLYRSASGMAIDRIRSDSARRKREQNFVFL